MKQHTHSKTLYLGRRKVTDVNFSKVVTLPKAFTDNYLDENKMVEVSLSLDGRLILISAKAEKVPA